jgi:hypothetical protein
MIWVYAIAERPDLPLPDGRGLADAPLEGVAAGDLIAVVTRHDEAPAEGGADALWAHERVVERIMEDRAVLPMRFSSTLRDDAELRDVLRARHDELRAALDRVRGRVELGVRAVATTRYDAAREEGSAAPEDGSAAADQGSAAADEGPSPSGTAWLMDRLETGRREDRLAAAVHEPLAALSAASARRAARAPGEVLRAAYLVDRGSLAGFGDALNQMQRTLPEVAVVCTGPWPPYSFVDA